jgi:hypothetical protein
LDEEGERKEKTHLKSQWRGQFAPLLRRTEECSEAALVTLLMLVRPPHPASVDLVHNRRRPLFKNLILLSGELDNVLLELGGEVVDGTRGTSGSTGEREGHDGVGRGRRRGRAGRDVEGVSGCRVGPVERSRVYTTLFKLCE